MLVYHEGMVCSLHYWCKIADKIVAVQVKTENVTQCDDAKLLGHPVVTSIWSLDRIEGKNDTTNKRPGSDWAN